MLPSEKKRHLIDLRRASTNPQYGKRPVERTLEEHIRYGIIALDKPVGPTSHEVVSWVKKILSLNNAGHGGTLDPKVSGLLPVALEESTKVIQALLPAGKEYTCIMRLHEKVPQDSVEKVMKEIEGKIYQKPPIKSAVKRQLRIREIYYINILEVDNQDVLFKVGCEAGTYIRKLCHDVGEILGTGAHMLELRRTKSGSLNERDMTTLHNLLDGYTFYKEKNIEDFLKEAILPVESGVKFLPRVIISDMAVDAVAHGADLAVPGIVSLDSEIQEGNLVAIFTLKDELVAIGKTEMDIKKILVSKSGIAVKPTRVLMPTGIYPKGWKKKEN